MNTEAIFHGILLDAKEAEIMTQIEKENKKDLEDLSTKDRPEFYYGFIIKDKKVINLTVKNISENILGLHNLTDLDIRVLLSQIPEFLAKLTSLRTLKIKITVDCVIPESILQMQNLVNLDISSDDKKKLDKIPLFVYSLVNLESLTLRHFDESFHLTEDTSKLTKLRKITIYGLKKYEFPNELLLLPQLEEIVIPDSKINKLPDLKILKNLRKLDLKDHNVSKKEELAKLGDLVSLEDLNIVIHRKWGNYDQYTQLPSELWNLVNLKSLVLGSEKLYEISEDIGKLIDLETLELHINIVKQLPQSLKGLKHLKYLNLSLQYVNEHYISQLGSIYLEIPNIPSVERLHCEFLQLMNKITPLPLNLKDFSIKHGNISHFPSPNQEIHPNLVCLQLEYINQEKRPIIINETLRNFPNLKKLRLNNMLLTQIPPILFELSKLEELDLSDNMIEVIPNEINRLKSLKRLILSGNGISEIPDTIADLHELNELKLEKNFLSAIPPLLSQLNIPKDQIEKIGIYPGYLFCIGCVNLGGDFRLFLRILPHCIYKKEYFYSDINKKYSFYKKSIPMQNLEKLLKTLSIESNFFISGEEFTYDLSSELYTQLGIESADSNYAKFFQAVRPYLEKNGIMYSEEFQKDQPLNFTNVIFAIDHVDLTKEYPRIAAQTERYWLEYGFLADTWSRYTKDEKDALHKCLANIDAQESMESIYEIKISDRDLKELRDNLSKLDNKMSFPDYCSTEVYKDFIFSIVCRCERAGMVHDKEFEAFINRNLWEKKDREKDKKD